MLIACNVCKSGLDVSDRSRGAGSEVRVEGTRGNTLPTTRQQIAIHISTQSAAGGKCVRGLRNLSRDLDEGSDANSRLTQMLASVRQRFLVRSLPQTDSNVSPSRICAAAPSSIIFSFAQTRAAKTY